LSFTEIKAFRKYQKPIFVGRKATTSQNEKKNWNDNIPPARFHNPLDLSLGHGRALESWNTVKQRAPGLTE
jgi:hypothetical protein